MNDWVVPLATFILAVPAALVALYRSVWGRDHQKMQELEGRILKLESDLLLCRARNADLVEENFRLLKKIVEGPDCPYTACPLSVASYTKPVQRDPAHTYRFMNAGGESLPPNAAGASG